jgi:hypothetical protein
MASCLLFPCGDCTIPNLQRSTLIDTSRIWILRYPEATIMGIHCPTVTQDTKTGMAVQMLLIENTTDGLGKPYSLP